MRILAKLGLCLAIAGASTPVIADIIFNGTAIPSTDITTIEVDPRTGDVRVTTINDWIVQQGTTTDPTPPPEPTDPPPTDPPPAPDGPISMSFSATPTTVEQGAQVIFSWDTVNAVSCDAKLGNAAWQNTAITPNDPGSASNTLTDLGQHVLFR